MFAHSTRPSIRSHHLEQVVVVHPVDRDEDEAEDVGEELPLLVEDVAEVIAVRRLQFEHEDRDQDRDHAVGEPR